MRITKKQLQEELQAKSANVVNYFIETIEKEAEKLFDIETMKESWLSDAYPEMRQFIEDRLKESWELNEISATIYDYGLADFRNRRIETFIFDVNSKIILVNMLNLEILIMVPKKEIIYLVYLLILLME
mgnify:CR=1 FL=1